VSATVHKTKGIVLRAVKYGETSLIVSIYTELFGIQSYIVNGVRVSSKKGAGKANYFQPAAILELEVYHNDLKNLQRIKEFRWFYLYQHVLFDVIRNSVAAFMIELLQKTIRQPETNPDLYHFIEDALIHLDQADALVTANFPIYFASHLTNFFGFRISDDYDPDHTVLDLQEGAFVHDRPLHPHFLEEPYSQLASQFLKAQQPGELKEIRINQEKRRTLMNAYQTFYALQVQDFGVMKTLPVLQEVL
jgi:DNA repair protein RecO (recombination protein O)